MPVDFRGGVQLNVAENLHPDDGVYEEQHADQQAHVGQGLRLNKRLKISGLSRVWRGMEQQYTESERKWVAQNCIFQMTLFAETQKRWISFYHKRKNILISVVREGV